MSGTADAMAQVAGRRMRRGGGLVWPTGTTGPVSDSTSFKTNRAAAMSPIRFRESRSRQRTSSGSGM
jgi:hypothetical protein